MKVVYDTCLYIDLLRSANRLPLFQDRSFIRFLSPIVVMELLAGAQTSRERKTLDKLFRPYDKAGRIIPMGSNLFSRAGQCLSKMGSHRGLAHDVLIALSAVSIGATLLTNNRRDFERIAKFVPLRAQYV